MRNIEIKLQHYSSFIYKLEKESEGKEESVCVVCAPLFFVLQQEVAPPFREGVGEKGKSP